MEFETILKRVDIPSEAREAIENEYSKLKERVKELTCLYELSKLTSNPQVSMDDVIRGTLLLIPPAWQYPELTCARILMEGNEYISPTFQETPWKQSADVQCANTTIGIIEVFYREEQPEFDEGPFLKEERDLIDALARELGKFRERKQVQKAFKGSEDRYKTLFETIREGIITTDSKGWIIGVNPAAVEFFGFKSSEEMLGTHVSALWMDQDQRKAMLDKLMKKGFIDDIEVLGKKKDGTPINILVSFTANYDDKDSFLGIFRDQTARNQAEKDLRESETRWRNLVLNIPSFIAELDLDGKIISLNKVQPGLSLEDFIGKTIFEITPSEGLEDLNSAISTVLKNHIPVAYEHANIGPDGTQAWYYHHLAPVKSAENELESLIAVITDITHIKKAEEALQESEERLRDFINSATDGIAIYDSELNFLDLNKGISDLAGLPKEEIIGKSILDIFPHLMETKRYTDYKSVMETGESFILDDLFVPESFGDTHLYVRAFKVGNGLGITTTDVTARIQMEEELIKREYRLKTAQKVAHLGFWEWDLTTNELYWSDEGYRSIGDEPQSYKPSFDKFRSMVHPDDVEFVQKAVNDAINDVKEYNVDFRYLFPNGEIKHIHAQGEVVRDKKGKAIQFFGTQQNITERKLAEIELIKEKELTEALINNMPCTALLLRPKTREIVAANTYGIEAGAVPGKTCYETWAQRETPCPFCLAPKGWKTMEEQALIVEYGGVIWDAHWIPIKDDLYLHYAFDVTKQKKAEKVERELEKRRENFVWMTSHELRTPLTVISGYFDFLEKNLESLDQNLRKQSFKAIKNNLARLTRLTNDVGLLTQFERGFFEIKRIKFEFGKFLIEIKKQYENLLGEQFVVQDKSHSESPVIIEGDKTRLQQAVESIINNAIKNTHPEKRQIDLKLDIQPSILRVSITDNGTGIAPENLERIFKQFVSIETEYSSTGTGLGLYLCQMIIEAHEGTVTARSKGLGHGATFIIEMPRKID